MSKYSLYHYRGPASHLLVGPSGLWVLLPYYQKGAITYADGRYKQKGGNLYLKIFAQEGLGGPRPKSRAETENVRDLLTSSLPEGELPPVNAALVFTNPRRLDRNRRRRNPACYGRAAQGTERCPAQGKARATGRSRQRSRIAPGCAEWRVPANNEIMF